MNKKLILLVALLFVFAIAAGTFHAVNAADDKAKSSTVQKDDCCKKNAADCKEKAADCKEKADAKECAKEKSGCCSKAKTEAAASEAKCAGCPAKSACEKK